MGVMPTVIAFLLVVLINLSTALRCYKCVRFDCAYDNQTICDKLQLAAISFAASKYFDGKWDEMPPTCPPASEQKSWNVLEEWRVSKCPQESPHCLLSGFEIRSRLPTDKKSAVSVGTISGCSSSRKRRKDLQAFKPHEYCMLQSDNPILTMSASSVSNTADQAESILSWHNAITFETCRLEAGENCSSCSVCFGDFCTSKERIAPQRVIFVETPEGTLVSRYILAFVVLIMVFLAAADKDFPWIL